MFKNVLVGVDGRANGRDGIALASCLVDADAQLMLAHVHPGRLRPTHALSPALVREEREASETLLEQARLAAGLDARLTSIEALSPGRGLHEQAEEQASDLLVVGSCSRGALGRVALGDDTRAALNGAPCAVAIAAAGYAERSAPLAKIGVAYDGSPESGAALAAGRELAVASGATLHVLEVVSIPSIAYTVMGIPPVVGADIDAMVQEAADRMRLLPGVKGRAVYGLPGEELARFGDEVDLLIVGSRGYGAVKRLVLGSTSEYLERHAHCSLLVLPRAASARGAHGPSADEAEAATPAMA